MFAKLREYKCAIVRDRVTAFPAVRSAHRHSKQCDVIERIAPLE